MKDRKYIKIFILAAAILLFVKVMFDFGSLTGVFSSVMRIIRPFFFGFILAYCINIPVSWLEEKLKKIKFKWIRKVARPISILVNLSALVGFIIFGLMSIVPMLYNNIKQLVSEMPGYINMAVNGIKNMPFADELGLSARLDQFKPEDVADFFTGLLPSPDNIAGIAAGFFAGIVTVFLTIVATLYFLIEYNSIKDFIKRFIRAHSPKRQRPALKYIRLVDSSFRKFLTCQTIDALILGTITMIQFTIMRSPYAVTLGLMLGIANMIPYFGSIVGSIVATFLIWASSGLNIAIIAGIMLLITQQIDGNFIMPKLMGSSIKMSPVLVIIAITIGGSLANIIGVFFAIPVANVIKTTVDEYLQTKEKQRIASGNWGGESLLEADKNDKREKPQASKETEAKSKTKENKDKKRK
ncbi:MAG: AI-2E family transporter [Oscillospiraceae bacterium]|nr:AI-2E family transporter [Oscillospiraceae bacterium]